MKTGSPKATTASSSRVPVSEDLLSPNGIGITRPLKEQQHHFPFKLYDMLEYVSNSERCSAVSWSEDGKAFSIHEKDTFLEEIVPMFFNQTKFRSFTRQLNIWSFTRLQDGGPNGGSWANEHFIRGRVEGLSSIQRVEVKSSSKPKTRARQSSNSKPKKRKTARTCNAKHTAPRDLSPVHSTSSSFSTGFGFEDNANHSMSMEPVDPPPAVPVEHIMSNHKFQYQTAWRPSSISPQLPAYVSPGTFHANSQSSTYGFNTQPITQRYRSNMSPVPHYAQPQLGRTNEEDILFLLAGIFDPEESSNNDDDLCSILTLNDLTEDFMNPISF